MQQQHRLLIVCAACCSNSIVNVAIGNKLSTNDLLRVVSIGCDGWLVNQLA